MCLIPHINIFYITESSRWKLLQEETVLHLRQQAEITCPETNHTTKADTECRPDISPCLFNIRDDPCEQVNLALDRPLVLHSLEESLQRLVALFGFGTLLQINFFSHKQEN